jgi:hypothetical protein
MTAVLTGYSLAKARRKRQSKSNLWRDDGG